MSVRRAKLEISSREYVAWCIYFSRGYATAAKFMPDLPGPMPTPAKPARRQTTVEEDTATIAAYMKAAAARNKRHGP